MAFFKAQESPREREGERKGKIFHTVAISPTNLSRSCKNGVLTTGAWDERVAIV